MDEYYRAVRALPAWLARPLSALPPDTAEQVHEIRLRVGCGVQLTIGGKPCCPAELPALQKLRLTPLQMEEIFVTLCGGSVHSHETEIAAGYVTLSCGCRAGLAGQFYCAPGQSAVLQELRSVNIRVARNREFPLPQKLRDILQQRFIGMLLMGEPDSGKTTLLRGIARELAKQNRAVAVIDERREIFPSEESAALPLDILSGIPKGPAVQMALRTLAAGHLVGRAGRDGRALRAGAGTFQRGGIYRHTSCCQLGRSCPPSAGAVSAKVRCAPCGSASERPHCTGAAERGASIVKMLRVVCALFWLGCGWCAGDAACQNTRQHLAALEKTLLLLQRVRQEINYRHTDLALLFRRLEQEGLVTGESFRDLCPLPGLTRPERDCFIECFSSLGRMEAEQECQQLAFYQERFTLFLQQAQEHARPQLELSHKLGFAAGLAAAILCL